MQSLPVVRWFLWHVRDTDMEAVSMLLVQSCTALGQGRRCVMLYLRIAS